MASGAYLSIDKRIAIGWIVGLTLLWLLLQFVFRVPYAWAWPLIIIVAVGVNGYVASNVEGDG